ncbi:MAG TPA: flagellar motor protein MotB [Polyangia bacterium]|jgi:chemotaxis protein MotB|nr:flagellar motor protein MotB [Polyangia bacterium]
MGKKRGHEEEHENHERWLVSYADFITLLFAFFVVLYATSRVDNKRMAQVVHSIKFAMHFKGTGGVDSLPLFEGPPTEGGGCKESRGGTQDRPKTIKREAAEQVRKKIDKKLRRFLQIRPDQQAVVVESEHDRLTVRLSASHFFDPSQAAIRPEMLPVLDAISQELVLLGMPLRVEGHTDESRVNNPKFRDNWELSASRASAVAAYVERAHKMDGKLLSAAGYGATRPLASNTTPAGREANRRVEMLIQFNPGE